jgi:carbonic anhydrase
VVVLGHDSCGAVAAATAALNDGVLQRGFVRAVVDRVIPSIVGVGDSSPGGTTDAAALGEEHVRQTVRMMQDYSVSLAEAVAAGRCAIVGLQYALADGTVHLVETAGQI